MMNPSRNIELVSETGRLRMRPPVMEDAPAFCQAVRVSIPELRPWMDWAHPEYVIEETREWLEKLPQSWQEGEHFAFGVFETQSGILLGGCGLNHINRFYRIANLGYWVRSDRTGQGVATEAARRVAQFGFSELGLRRVEIVVAEDNWASRRVAAKTGAQYEGILRRRIKIGDRNFDAAMHSLIPEDFQGSG
jgi:ribosomal-protein-serine acetyltransferase